LCIIPGYRGIRWLKTGEIKMRKVALLAAVIVAAAFSSTSNVAVAEDMNPNTTKFLQDAVNPYVATAKPAAPAMKGHRHHHHHMMKKHKK
jgi:Spy/CpxP family protein refolding chaperone